MGDWVGRQGRWPNGARVQAIRDFSPIKQKVELQQFLGCTNWVRYYLAHFYPALVKMIGKYLRHMKTNVAFIIHDSVILDMPYEERHLLPQIIEISLLLL